MELNNIVHDDHSNEDSLSVIVENEDDANEEYSFLVSNAKSLLQKGKEFERQGLHKQAFEQYGEAKKLMQSQKITKEFEECYFNVLQHWCSLAAKLLVPSAMKEWKRYCELVSKSKGSTSIEYVLARKGYARAMTNNLQYKQASEIFEDCVKILEEHRGSNLIEYLRAVADLAFSYEDLGNLSEALVLVTFVKTSIEKNELQEKMNDEYYASISRTSLRLMLRKALNTPSPEEKRREYLIAFLSVARSKEVDLVLYQHDLVNLARCHLLDCKDSQIPPDLPYVEEFAHSIYDLAQTRKRLVSTTNKYALYHLALCVLHKIMCPNAQLRYGTRDHVPDFTNITQVRWKLGAMALKYVRMLSANENLQSHRMRSVLTCILRVIVNDGSPNQSGFNRLLSYGTSKSTLGLGANALFSQGFVGCSSSTLPLYIETLHSACELGTKEALSLKPQIVFFHRFRMAWEHALELNRLLSKENNNNK